MTKTLTTHLKEKVKNDELIFIPYIMAGANGLAHLEEEIEMLIKNGASAIEIGVPFSDPVADGPIIQEAGLKALENGTSLKKIINTLQGIHSDVPLILMGYANSFYHYGFSQLVTDLESTDVKGLIIADIPYEHKDFINDYIKESDLALIPLVTLTSSKERIEKIAKEAEGFIYAVTVKGVTGIGKEYQNSLDDYLKEVKAISDVPVLAGFGISSKEDVARFFNVCDGVVVGSKIVDTLDKKGQKEAGELVAALVG